MEAKKWFRNCILIILAVLFLSGALVAWLDPFFHFHGPVRGFYYVLDEQRMQNDGITKHFDYDAIITGTSMTENFKASECDALFGVRSIKIPYSGATYRELDENLRVAFATHDDIKIVVRGMDLSMLARDPMELREDMGDYPEYLTNDNPVDDIKYLLNRDAIGRYCGVMLLRRLTGHSGGITSFDDYSYTGDMNEYAPDYALQWDYTFEESKETIPLSEEEARMARENVRRNVCETAAAHPETTFYYFIPPYSMAYWGNERENGTLERALALQQILIEEMLTVDNIRVYAFGLKTEITADLHQYHDRGHYSPAVNTAILEWMSRGTAKDGLITKDTAEQYLREFETLVKHYDYLSLTEQLEE